MLIAYGLSCMSNHQMINTVIDAVRTLRLSRNFVNLVMEKLKARQNNQKNLNNSWLNG